jgi:hypothetical protein
MLGRFPGYANWCPEWGSNPHWEDFKAKLELFLVASRALWLYSGHFFSEFPLYAGDG